MPWRILRTFRWYISVTAFSFARSSPGNEQRCSRPEVSFCSFCDCSCSWLILSRPREEYLTAKGATCTALHSAFTDICIISLEAWEAFKQEFELQNHMPYLLKVLHKLACVQMEVKVCTSWLSRWKSIAQNSHYLLQYDYFEPSPSHSGGH